VPRLATVLLRHRPCHFFLFFLNSPPPLRQNKNKQTNLLGTFIYNYSLSTFTYNHLLSTLNYNHLLSIPTYNHLLSTPTYNHLLSTSTHNHLLSTPTYNHLLSTPTHQRCFPTVLRDNLFLLSGKKSQLRGKQLKINEKWNNSNEYLTSF